MCVHCEGTPTERQRTFGDVVGLEPVMPVQPDPVTCTECGETSRAMLVEDCEGNEVCSDCFDESSFRCDNCGCVDCTDDQYIDNATDETLCESCYGQRYTECAACACEVAIGGDDVEAVGRRHYCRECYDELYTTCDGCDEVISRNDSYYCERRDECFCSSCTSDDSDCSAEVFRFKEGDTTDKTGSLRTFGVELETAECYGFSDLDGETHFSVKEDRSISGMEFVSEVLRGDRGIDAVTEFCRRANRLGFDVDYKCGYHLHIGVDDLDDTQRFAVMLAYRYTEGVWSTFVDDDRATENTFCLKLPFDAAGGGVASWNDVVAKAGGNRHKWVNVCAYAEHGTIEIRLHGGTLNAEDVTNWVCGHLRFVDHFAAMTPAEVHAYFASRVTLNAQMDALHTAWNSPGLSEHFVDKSYSASSTQLPELVEAVQ